MDQLNGLVTSESEGIHFLICLPRIFFLMNLTFQLDHSEADKRTSVSAVASAQVESSQADQSNVHLEDHLSETISSDPEVEQLMKLPETVTQLTSKDGVKVYLVGTAHFSQESQEDVAKVVTYFCINLVFSFCNYYALF